MHREVGQIGVNGRQTGLEIGSSCANAQAPV
jgi:hypothetical protein